GKDKEIRSEISRAVDASPSLRNKKDLIDAFVDDVSVDSAVDEEWQAFVAKKCGEELDAIINAESLHPGPARDFMQSAFREGILRTSGTSLTKVLPPVSRFAAKGGHSEKKQRVIQQLQAFFDRFYGLVKAEEQ
ncbi:type I restriction endonuclease subunit R, EcoR124 family, partial [Corynebacterium sp. LK2510]|uniref:type I restriction endonuclease subunit R, EcoR124 family n=1 Tax=Corynebacterium sp. LK2510 TaxID=3110472 RepID=UPI0034D025FC